MIRAVILALGLASPAAAECIAAKQLGSFKGSDEIWLTSPAADRMLLHYHNSITQSSATGTHVLCLDGRNVAVTITMEMEDGGRERVTVRPPEGFMAIPESDAVLDGDTTELLIIRLLHEMF